MSIKFPFTPKPQFTDSNGDPLTGGFLYVYSAGTSAPSTSYSDSALSTANANPIVLDARGECDLFLADGSYKFVLKDSEGVTIWTVDNITIEDFSSSSDLVTKYEIQYTDLSAAATTSTYNILSLPAKTIIEYIIIKHSVIFAGGAISALTVDIGDASDADRLISGFNVMATVAEAASEVASVHYIGAFESATNIVLTATATGANLDQLTQGTIEVWVKKRGML